jgi:hypothetical protein
MYCACCTTKTEKKIKILDYKFLISGQDNDNLSNDVYDFVVSIKSKMGKGMPNLPETTLISTIV